MAGTDGSITFSTELDNAQLEKDLAGMKQKIKELEKSLSESQRAEATAVKEQEKAYKNLQKAQEDLAKAQEKRDSLLDQQEPLIQQLDNVRLQLNRAKEAVQKYKKQWLAGVKGADREWSSAEERVQALHTEYDEILEKIEKMDPAIYRANAALSAQESRVSELLKEYEAAVQAVDDTSQQSDDIEAAISDAKDQAGEMVKKGDRTEADQLKDIAENAEVSNQHIAELNKELAELRARQSELERAGLGLGFQEYDRNVARIAEITRELREYQRVLQENRQEEEDPDQGRPDERNPNVPINRMVLAGQKLVSILSKAGGVLKTIGSTAVSAFKTVGKAVLSAAKGILTAMKNLNVFAKLSKSLGSAMKSLGQSIKQAFVFSVAYKGLTMLKQQLGSYLAANAEFSTALSRLKGVLLTAFQPIYDAALPALTTLINVLSRAIAAVAEFISVLFGTTAKRAQANAKALNSQAAATSAAGNAAEEASEQLAAFDEINKLEDTSSSGGGGGTGGGEVDTGPLFDWEYDDPPYESWGEAFSAFLDKILNGIPKLREAFAGFASWLNDLSGKLYEMFTFPGVQDKVILIGQELAKAFNDLVIWIDWNQLGMALGAGLNLALQFLVNFLYTFDWMNLGSSLAALINGAVAEIDWYAMGQLLWSGFKLAIETLAGFILGLDMPALAQAASELVIGFFNSISETLESIDWEGIGRQVRDFLVNVDWAGIVEAVFGAIKSAFTASSDFFSGLLGEELKRQITDILLTLSKASLVIGALLAFTGVNIPLGLKLMELGALGLAAAAALDWDYVSENIEGIVTDMLLTLSAASLVIGALLCFSGINIGLGIALIALGATSLGAAAAVNWETIKNALEGPIGAITATVGAALLVLGAVLLFSGASIPLGLGLLLGGATGLAATIGANWETIKNALEGPLGVVTQLVSAALLVLGTILLFTGAGIPLGLGLIAAGATGLATTISANWETIQNALQGPIGAVVAIASAALLALGVILLFSGAGVPLGLGLILAGAAGLAATLAPNTAFLDSVVHAFTSFKDAVLGIFNAIWDGIKFVVNGVLGFVEGLANGVINGINFVIGALNKLHFDIPSWVPVLGGKSFGFNIPKLSNVSIPRLAQGAVIPPNREFLAVLGDQKSGNNIEAPEGLIRKIVREESGGGDYSALLQAILDAIKAGHIIMVDRRVLGQTVTQEQNRMTRAGGRAVLLG